MTDDASPIPQALPDNLNQVDDREDTNGDGDNQIPRNNGDSSRQQQRRRRRPKTKVNKPDQGLVKKVEFLTHLLKNLDMLVYAELAALYYMECSALRFFFRGWCQQNFLSPKPDDWPIPLPAIQAQVLSVFFPTFICVLAHIIESLPFAGETTRGYLHGGVIVDFIGQKPPATRFTLFAFDILIFGLQCLMLSVHEERERLRKTIRPKSRRTRTTTSATAQDTASTDAGLSTDVPALDSAGTPTAGADTGNPDDIELQPLSRHNSAADDDDERRPFLSRSPTPPTSRITLLDVLNSGNGMIRDFHVMHTIRNATPDFWGTVGHGLRSAGYHATLARIRARTRSAPSAADQV